MGCAGAVSLRSESGTEVAVTPPLSDLREAMGMQEQVWEEIRSLALVFEVPQEAAGAGSLWPRESSGPEMQRQV